MGLLFVDTISVAQYNALRNSEVKKFENGPLAAGDIPTAELETDPNGNFVIGYGWDLDVNSAQDTLDAFDAAGLALSTDERAALVDYKNGNLTWTPRRG
jgi:hypothetical protein